MAMYVREAFLHNAKQPELQSRGSRPISLGASRVNFDPAALSESRHIPRQNAHQTKFLKQRRMEKI